MPRRDPKEETAMTPTHWSRRDLLKTVSGAAAQAVKWSAGTEAPKLKAPANATDCRSAQYL